MAEYISLCRSLIHSCHWSKANLEDGRLLCSKEEELQLDDDLVQGQWNRPRNGMSTRTVQHQVSGIDLEME